MPPTKLTKFVNCRILRNHELVIDDLYVRDDKIVDPRDIFFVEKRSADRVVDVGGFIIAPGYIDIQINGGFGIDFSYDTSDPEKAISTVAKGILAHGVTSFCPTLVTSSPSVYKKVLPFLKKSKGSSKGAAVLGAHVEGPFISKEKNGAHEVTLIANLSEGIESVKKMYGDLENIAIITLAPEIPNALDTIEELAKRNIVVSLGHSTANIDIGEAALKKGARLLTHLFNAMLPFHHRDPGLVGLLASNCCLPVFYGIISDGVHTHPSALRIAKRVHPSGLVLVTDAISALGLSEGVHHIGKQAIEVLNGKAFVANTNTLCGSIASLDRCVQHFVEHSGASIAEGLEAASLHPALALGIEQSKGTLNFGSDADFIILNDDLKVLSTWIAGEKVYESS